MAAAIPTSEPTEHQAGNTLQFSRNFADYPASDGWSLSYVLRGNLDLTQANFAAVANGKAFSIHLLPAITSDGTPGTYLLVGYIANGTDRFEVYRGTFVVTRDASIETGFDPRSFWVRILERLQSVYESGVIRAPIRYSFNGVSTDIHTFDELEKAIAYAESKVLQEQGHSRQQRVLTRFIDPR